MATLTIRRDSGWADCLRAYRVLVDGKEVGRVGNGKSFECEVAPGAHMVQARIDWCGTPIVTVQPLPRA